MKIKFYWRCLLLAMIATADTEKIEQWFREIGWRKYHLVHENIERTIQEMKDELLGFEEE